MKQILYFLIAGTRGGETRARIINAIKKKPRNLRKLALDLKLDYKTVQHHIRILAKHKLIQKQGEYGGVYFISENMKLNMDVFNEMWKQLK